MPVSLSIKNVPDGVAKALRERARQHHRSMQGELLSILEDAVRKRKLTIEEVYSLGRELGLQTGDESAAIVREDRDGR